MEEMDVRNGDKDRAPNSERPLVLNSRGLNLVLLPALMYGPLPEGRSPLTVVDGYECRHDTCSYRKRVWKDKRSRCSHEETRRYHRCPPGCLRCDAMGTTSLKDMGRVLCPHDGCPSTVINRRHKAAHEQNKILHQSRCTATCAECILLGWTQTMPEADMVLTVPIPSSFT